MRKLAIAAVLTLGFAQASVQSTIDKIIHIHNIQSNQVLEFNATKSSEGYDVAVTSSNPQYQRLFNKNAKIKLHVDEGPIVTTPKFTLAKLGLSAKGSLLDLLNPKLHTKKPNFDLNYSYAGVVSFGNELEEKLTIAPIDATDKDGNHFATSKFKLKSETNLDKLTGKSEIKLESLNAISKKDNSKIALKELELKTKVTQKPVDSIVLFSDTKGSIKELAIEAKSAQKNIALKIASNFESSVSKVDEKFLNVAFKAQLKALDTQTIALAQGIKSTNLEVTLKNFGTKGVVELVKLSQKINKANNDMLKASRSGNDIAMQKAILESQELANGFIPAINDALIKDKSRAEIDLELQSDKKSFIKCSFVYKGEPLSGANMQSAMISLMAQQLALVDGDFDIALERSLVVTTNPMALLVLDMLKGKGIVALKDGIYRLKGSLKGGKIILNGKAYTIKELARVLF